MENLFSQDLLWWIKVIELPALAGLLALVIKTREEVVAGKIESLRNFATVSAMREVEQRLVSHLLRIEAKLDKTALKTESLVRGRP
ncbi:MAG: hypothetical protein EBQ96_02770 [Proteobacteria bacterium]|nr:hypothetical protein [Pseudomonadota bacterium]